MPLYTMLVPTRADWQKMRNEKKVPKGASKVSIGDTIATVHKSFSLKTASQNVKDTDKLITNLNTYLAAIKPKYPAFVPVVEKILKNTRAHKKIMEDVVTASQGYLKAVANAEYIFVQIKRNAQVGPKQLAKQLQTLKGFLDAMGLLDDNWTAMGRQAGGWMNKCENLKTGLSAQDITGLEAFFAKCQA